MPVVLSCRPGPLPGLRAAARAVADAARAAYDAPNTGVDTAFAGVEEAEADYRPAPDDWTAKQVVAHLIAVERDMQTWITTLIEGDNLTDPFHANEGTCLNALVAAYPTLAELLAELKRSEAATVTILATSPPAVARRKYLLFLLAKWIPGLPEHGREHLREVRYLLATANMWRPPERPKADPEGHENTPGHTRRGSPSGSPR